MTAPPVIDARMRASHPHHVLDVACGTGFLTRHLRGEVEGIDQSPAMVAIAAGRMPNAPVAYGDAVPLPFADRAFERIFTAHFYGHLQTAERRAFLAEAGEWVPSWWWSTRRSATASTPRSGRSGS